MLDLGFLRDNLDLVDKKLRDRNMDPHVILREFRSLDQVRRERITEAEGLKAEQNRVTKEIARLKKAGEDTSLLVEAMRKLREDVVEAERGAEQADNDLRGVLKTVPTLPHDSVPVGKDEHGNQEV